MFVLAHTPDGAQILINPANVIYVQPGPLYQGHEAGCYVIMIGSGHYRVEVELGDSFDAVVKALTADSGRYAVPA